VGGRKGSRSGVGIPAADLPHLFEQFYRGTNVSGRIAGTGIGLATARRVIEQHEGRIEVETVEGQGSTFTVNFHLPWTHELHLTTGRPRERTRCPKRVLRRRPEHPASHGSRVPRDP
jgi:hypothetical protein